MEEQDAQSAGEPQDTNDLQEQPYSEMPEVLPDDAPVIATAGELERLQREAHDYREKYLHALAEGENARKRLYKERHETLQHTIQSVIVDFLNPIDQLENALKYAAEAPPEVKNWAIGFEMILTQFKDVLASHGVSSFASEGHPFDPHFHEAIETVHTDKHPPGTVVKENIPGYKTSSGRVIRPARVHVSKNPENKEKDQ